MMTVASQSEPTEIGDPNDFCSQQCCCELYSVRCRSVLLATQAGTSKACTTQLRGEAGKYAKGIALKTKQKPNMHLRGTGMLCIEDGQVFL
jgi:hypothetical protein